MTRDCVRRRLLYGVALAFLAGAAEAQTIEEVVVTAQKREQNLQDVGIAVSAFGEEQIKALGISTADNIADSVSGVQVFHYRGKGQPAFVVRGVGTQDFAPNTSPTAAVYLDEVYLGSNIVSGSQIFDVSRVEVLKGPQGTLFGRNTTGGAISYTTKRPSREFQGYAEVGYANYDTSTASFGAGGPVADWARLRAALTISNQDKGHYRNIFTPAQNPFPPTRNFVRQDADIGDDFMAAGRVLAEFDIADDATLLLNLHAAKRRSDTHPVTPIGFTTIPGSGGTCLATASGGAVSDPRFCGDAFGYSDRDGDEYTVSNDYVGRNKEESIGASSRLEWDFEGARLTSITAFEHAAKRQTADADGSPFSVFANVTDVKLAQYSQELRLSSKNGDRLFWVVGAYYSHDKIKQGFCGDLNPLIGLGIACRNDFNQSTATSALFGQVEYRLTEQLRLTTGLRYTHEAKDFYSLNTFTDETGRVTIANFGSRPEDAAIIDDSVRDSNVSGRLGLDYFVNDDVLLYASFSRGYKSGGYDGDFSFTRQQLDAYDSETISAYEFGWKMTLAEGRVRFNGAAFYYDYSKPQVRVQRVSSAGLPFNQLINLNAAEVRGAEAEVLWQATRNLRFGATATLLDTKIKEDSPDPALALFDGNQFALSAKKSFTVMGRYEHPISDDLSAAFQLDGKYTGKFHLNAENLPWLAQDEHFLVNARLSIYHDAGGWELSLWGENLTKQTFATGSYALFGAFPVSYNTPRTYGVKLRREW